MKRTVLAFLASIATLAVSASSFAEPQSMLADRLTRQREVEAVIWGMPAVNDDLMRQDTSLFCSLQ